MVKPPYKFYIYGKNGKTVVHLENGKPVPVDELQVDVSLRAAYDVEGVAQCVMVGEGRIKMEEFHSGELTPYRKCRIVEA